MDTVTDRKAKKRIQNRVAQRSYRQRMKARVEELQAKVDILECGRQHGQSRSMNAQSDSESSPIASNAALCITQRRPHEVRNHAVLQQISPVLHHTPNTSHNSINANSHISTTSSVPPYSLDPASQPLKQMTGFDLPRSSRAPNDMQLDLSGGAQLDQSGSQTPSGSSDYFHDYLNYAAGKCQQPSAPSSTDDMALQMLSAITMPDLSSISSKLVSSSSPSSLSSDPTTSLPDVQFPLDSWISEIEQVQFELDNVKNPETGADIEMSLQQASAQLSIDAPLEDRLKHVAEQAKVARFEDLDAVITAYHMSMAGKDSESPVSPAQTSLRRLPRLIASMRHAAREWKDWERCGFPLD